MEAVSQKQRLSGMLLMLLCALLWSIGGVLIKSIPWNAVAIAGVRSLIAAAVLGCYMAIRRYRFRVTRRTLTMMLFLAATHMAFVIATKLTTAANAIVIQNTSPLFVLLYFGLFRKQAFKPMDYLVVLFTILGVAICFLADLGSGGSPLGNGVALLSGVAFAGMLVSTGSAPEEERISGLLQGQLLTALIGVPFFFLNHTQVTLQSGLCMLALGVFQLGLSFTLYSVAAKNCTPLACSLLGTLEPLLNPVWVALFANEVPGVLSLIGGVIVIGSITVWCVQNARHTPAAGADGTV